MWGLRRQVSLLLDHGHHQARHYPIGMVWEEVRIVVDRVNQEEASHATLMQAAVLGTKSKKGAQAFRKILKEMTDG